MMKIPFESGGIVYDYIRAKDVKNVIDVIRRYFGPLETMNKAVGIQPEDFDIFANVIGNIALEEGLSLVARNSITGDFIAPVILKDFTTQIPEDTFKFSPKLMPIFGMMDNLTDMFIGERGHVKRSEVLELFIGLMPPEYQNMGISTSLWNASQYVAKENGFKSVVSTITGGASSHIALNKLGFNLLFEIPYKTYNFSGKQVFASIRETETCKFVEKVVA